MPDLEKGRVRPGSRSASPSRSSGHVAFPQRRRRSYLIIFLIGAVIFTAYSFDSSYSHSISSGSWNWVKDSMRPVEHKMDQTVMIENRPMADALSDTDPASLAVFEAAIPKPEASLNYVSSSSAAENNLNQAPSSSDHILFFLSVMKDKTYKVPESDAVRKEELMPGTKEKLLQSIRKLRLQDTKDADLYKEAHDDWTKKYRSNSPLTVFSKSYCPYSTQAKELLKSMKAQFDLYEVDLREDADALQSVLKDLSGHTTFPTIFVAEKLIGGSDDLAHLKELGLLKGLLEGANVRFTKTSA